MKGALLIPVLPAHNQSEALHVHSDTKKSSSGESRLPPEQTLPQPSVITASHHHHHHPSPCLILLLFPLCPSLLLCQFQWPTAASFPDADTTALQSPWPLQHHYHTWNKLFLLFHTPGLKILNQLPCFLFILFFSATSFEIFRSGLQQLNQHSGETFFWLLPQKVSSCATSSCVRWRNGLN